MRSWIFLLIVIILVAAIWAPIMYMRYIGSDTFHPGHSVIAPILPHSSVYPWIASESPGSVDPVPFHADPSMYDGYKTDTCNREEQLWGPWGLDPGSGRGPSGMLRHVELQA